MKKVASVALLIFLIVLSSFAQEQSQRVQLKTGEVITGTILENVEGKVLKLKINDKDVRSFKWDEIDTTYAVAGVNLDDWEKTERMFSTMRVLKDKGYSGVFNFGFVGLSGSSTEYTEFVFGDYWSGSNAYEGNYFHFSMANGYQFNPHFAFRAGVGIEIGKAMIIPVFSEIQLNALKRLLSPILILSPGYAWCFDHDHNSDYSFYTPLDPRGGGFYFTGNAGFRYSFSTYFAMQFTAGLRYQSVSDESASARIYGYNVRLGFEF